MSRIGKKPIPVDSKVTVTISGQNVAVKGPAGELSWSAPQGITVTLDEETKQVVVTRGGDDRQSRAFHGLTRALINNMVVGVSEGYTKRLKIEGVGYRAEMDGKNLVLMVGYSHPVVVNPPQDVSFDVQDRGRTIIINAIDKQVIGEVAANIRKTRPPEPYKGKGIRYEGEYVRRKAGKAGKV